MTWDENPELWDKVIIDEKPLTGVWEVQPVNGTVRNLQTKRSKGRDGAKHKDHGLKDVELRLVGKITSKMWLDWEQDHLRLMPATEGAEQAPHSISHPQLRSKVDKILIQGIKENPPNDQGLMIIEVSCKKYTPEPRPTKTTERFATDVSKEGKSDYEQIADFYAPPKDAELGDPLSYASPFTNQSKITDGEAL